MEHHELGKKHHTRIRACLFDEGSRRILRKGTTPHQGNGWNVNLMSIAAWTPNQAHSTGHICLCGRDSDSKQTAQEINCGQSEFGIVGVVEQGLNELRNNLRVHHRIRLVTDRGVWAIQLLLPIIQWVTRICRFASVA